MKTKFSYFFLVIVITCFTFCKKNKQEYIIEKNPGKFNLLLYTQLNYIKTQTGAYDTLLYQQADVQQYFTAQSSYTSAIPVNLESAFCNSLNLLDYPVYPQNKLGFIYPSNWQVNAPGIGTINYIDTSPIPTFTNTNWWTIDSIDVTQPVTIDFSNFKDYTNIFFQLLPYDQNYTQQIFFPQSQMTFSATPSFPWQQPFSFKTKVRITVTRYEQKLVNGINIGIHKVLVFLIPIKTYRQ